MATSGRMFITMKQAADIAGLSIRHFRRVILINPVPIINIRGKFFILRSKFQEWLESYRAKV